MKTKLLQKTVSVALTIVMLISCIPSVFAATVDDNCDEYEPGSVIVSLKFCSPSVESLLSGFEITEVRLITPGSSTQNVYLVRFTEKTAEIVREAIEVLNKSPYVLVAEPDYYRYIEPVDDPEPKEPTISVIMGDVDGDGVVSVKDVSLIQIYIGRLCDFNEMQMLSADTDGDGIISILDVAMVQTHLVGLIDNL